MNFRAARPQEEDSADESFQRRGAVIHILWGLLIAL